MREILPWLAGLQDGAALPYLLPLLVQVTGLGSASKHPDRWISAARSKEVEQDANMTLTLEPRWARVSR